MISIFRIRAIFAEVNVAIKLFISDLDDSLLRDDQTIGERTERALHALEERGVTIALASGRIYSAMRRYVNQLGVTAPAQGLTLMEVFYDPNDLCIQR